MEKVGSTILFESRGDERQFNEIEAVLRDLLDNEFYGKIELTFRRGIITKIAKLETFQIDRKR